jgi:DNA polymerase III epsilon subunit-like protein
VRRGLAAHGLPALDVPVLCTRLLARRLLPELGRYGLDPLCAHFGIENRARHRALGDAESTARALLELLAMARRRPRLATLEDLLALGAPGARRRGARRAAPDQAAAPAPPRGLLSPRTLART